MTSALFTEIPPVLAEMADEVELASKNSRVIGETGLVGQLVVHKKSRARSAKRIHRIPSTVRRIGRFSLFSGKARSAP